VVVKDAGGAAQRADGGGALSVDGGSTFGASFAVGALVLGGVVAAAVWARRRSAAARRAPVRREAAPPSPRSPRLGSSGGVRFTSNPLLEKIDGARGPKKSGGAEGSPLKAAKSPPKSPRASPLKEAKGVDALDPLDGGWVVDNPLNAK
jgi:hypothetical protein